MFAFSFFFFDFFSFKNKFYLWYRRSYTTSIHLLISFQLNFIISSLLLLVFFFAIIRQKKSLFFAYSLLIIYNIKKKKKKIFFFDYDFWNVFFYLFFLETTHLQHTSKKYYRQISKFRRTYAAYILYVIPTTQFHQNHLSWYMKIEVY